MKTMLVLALATFSYAAQAEVVTCSFTEPFFNVQVNEEARTVKVTSPEGEEFYDVLELTKKGEETRVVYGAGEEENHVLSYVRDWQGSDGMSDFLYPYSATYNVGEFGPLYGGCSTPSEQPREIDWGSENGGQGK